MTDLFARIKMNAELVAKEANDVSPFRSRDEKKALKRAKEAEREFRKSKGLEADGADSESSLKRKIKVDYDRNFNICYIFYSPYCSYMCSCYS